MTNAQHTAGFCTTERKGFHVTFENGWTVSVQFGYGNYGSNYDWPGDNPEDPTSRHFGKPPKASSAEVAAWSQDVGWLDFGSGDKVEGYQSPADVLALMNRVASFAPNGPNAIAAAEADLLGEALEVVKEGRRAIGDHFAPNDCYATGPLTGDPIRDLVQCPACSFIAMHDALLTKAGKDGQ